MKLPVAPLLLISVTAATDLIIPLYQYPAGNGEAWRPIVEAVGNNINLTTKIIINPANGPGYGDTVGVNDTQYIDGARNLLNASSNVQLLGYVHTQIDSNHPRCSVPYADVERDIRTWSTWMSQANITIQGIFIDEAPSDSNNDCVNYMRNLTTFIQNEASLLFPRRLVVFNPGSPGLNPGDLQPYYNMNPTLIVALETCFVKPVFGGGNCDECPNSGGYEVYDNDEFGGSIKRVLGPKVGKQNYNRTAVLVHGVHDTNGRVEISEEVLREMIRPVVRGGIGATFFNAAAYTQFTYDPVRIQLVARLLREENEATGVGRI